LERRDEGQAIKLGTPWFLFCLEAQIHRQTAGREVENISSDRAQALRHPGSAELMMQPLDALGVGIATANEKTRFQGDTEGNTLGSEPPNEDFLEKFDSIFSRKCLTPALGGLQETTLRNGDFTR
jgi:hypothetical protein